MKAELVLETLVYSPFNHLTRLLDRESFIEQNLWPHWFKYRDHLRTNHKVKTRTHSNATLYVSLCLVTSLSSFYVI